MTPADIAAYIGAAAWAPQIAAWLYHVSSKPRLKVVSARKVEIGYSMFGPIVNATLAISAERRDALVEKITLFATHEHGERRQLVWRFLNENQQQIRDPQGKISSQFKNNPAVALKVSTLALAERTVGFHDPEFEEFERTTSSSLVAQFRHLETQVGNAAALRQLLQSVEFGRAQREFERFMYWRDGRWSFLLSAQLAGVKSAHEESFEVTLTDDDIVVLRRNLEQLVPYTRATLSSDAQDQKLISWNWIYPVITATGQ